MARKKGSKNRYRRRPNILQSNEQVYKKDGINHYYVGNKLGGTFIGDETRGYISKSAIAGGNGYSKTYREVISQLRNQYWDVKFKEIYRRCE